MKFFVYFLSLVLYLSPAGASAKPRDENNVSKELAKQLAGTFENALGLLNIFGPSGYGWEPNSEQRAINSVLVTAYQAYIDAHRGSVAAKFVAARALKTLIRELAKNPRLFDERARLWAKIETASQLPASVPETLILLKIFDGQKNRWELGSSEGEIERVWLAAVEEYIGANPDPSSNDILAKAMRIWRKEIHKDPQAFDRNVHKWADAGRKIPEIIGPPLSTDGGFEVFLKSRAQEGPNRIHGATVAILALNDYLKRLELPDLPWGRRVSADAVEAAEHLVLNTPHLSRNLSDFQDQLALADAITQLEGESLRDEKVEQKAGVRIARQGLLISANSRYSEILGAIRKDPTSLDPNRRRDLVANASFGQAASARKADGEYDNNILRAGIRRAIPLSATDPGKVTGNDRLDFLRRWVENPLLTIVPAPMQYQLGRRMWTLAKIITEGEGITPMESLRLMEAYRDRLQGQNLPTEHLTERIEKLTQLAEADGIDALELRRGMHLGEETPYYAQGLATFQFTGSWPLAVREALSAAAMHSIHKTSGRIASPQPLPSQLDLLLELEKKGEFGEIPPSESLEAAHLLLEVAQKEAYLRPSDALLEDRGYDPNWEKLWMPVLRRAVAVLIYFDTDPVHAIREVTELAKEFQAPYPSDPRERGEVPSWIVGGMRDGLRGIAASLKDKNYVFHRGLADALQEFCKMDLTIGSESTNRLNFEELGKIVGKQYRMASRFAPGLRQANEADIERIRAYKGSFEDLDGIFKSGLERENFRSDGASSTVVVDYLNDLLAILKPEDLSIHLLAPTLAEFAVANLSTASRQERTSAQLILANINKLIETAAKKQAKPSDYLKIDLQDAYRTILRGKDSRRGLGARVALALWRQIRKPKLRCWGALAPDSTQNPAPIRSTPTNVSP